MEVFIMKSGLNRKFRDYYKTDRYKGFYKVDKRTRAFSRTTILTFTNGKKTIYASGMFAEEAMAKAFRAIDNYHSRSKRHKVDLHLA